MDKVYANNLTERVKGKRMKNRVLIVDDSRFALKILRDILTKENYSVIAEARNGHEAIEMAKEYKPDYVFLDVEMPLMDGVSALPKILEVNEPCYIIMCTAMGQQEIIDKSICAGAKDYVIKPYKRENIVGVMNVAATANKEGQVLPFKRSFSRNETDIDSIVHDAPMVENVEDIDGHNVAASENSPIADNEEFIQAQIESPQVETPILFDLQEETPEKNEDLVNLPTLEYTDLDYVDASEAIQQGLENKELEGLKEITQDLSVLLEEIGVYSYFNQEEVKGELPNTIAINSLEEVQQNEEVQQDEVFEQDEILEQEENIQQSVEELQYVEHQSIAEQLLEHQLLHSGASMTDIFSIPHGDEEVLEKSEESIERELTIVRPSQLIRRGQNQNSLIIGVKDYLDINYMWNHKLTYHSVTRAIYSYSHRWIAYSEVFRFGQGFGANSNSEEQFLAMLISSFKIQSRVFTQVSVEKMLNRQEGNMNSEAGGMYLLARGRASEITIFEKCEHDSGNKNYLGGITRAISEVLREKL